MSASPTTRARELLKRDGWRSAIVEKWNAHVGVRVDCFGFGDVLAVKPGRILMLQVTSATNVAARVTKILEERREEAIDWLEGGGEVAVLGFKKLEKRVDRRLWHPVWRFITYEDADLIVHGAAA